MDDHIYSKSTIEKFMNENFFFKDQKLKKYFEEGEFNKFRTRVRSTHSDKTFEKMMYVLITDSIRDIILDTLGEITLFLNPSGDLIVSGGEAFNLYVALNDRIVTSDIDAKFVPQIPMNEKYFGKLQVVKLGLWNKMGEVAKRLNTRVKRRIMGIQKKHPKLFKFMGVSFGGDGPYVTRRYTMIKKKKHSSDNTPSTSDVFIDVELFALDLNIRYFSPEAGKVQNAVIGGILDIPFMRPREFGYEVSLTKKKGMTYRDVMTGKLKNNKHLYIASKEFLIEDIYLMHKLRLRPEKKEKDRQRLVRLAQLIDKKITASNSIENVFKNIAPKIRVKKRISSRPTSISLQKALKIDPYKYKKFTTKPSSERLSKQLVYGLKPVLKNTNVKGYEKSSGNKRFNTKTLKWKNVKNPAYVKNEYPLRPSKSQPFPKNLNVTKTLYGYRPNRDTWVPKDILNKVAAIPFVGLKK